MALEREGFINQESGRKVLTVVHNSDLDTLKNDNYAKELKGSLREALRYTQKDNFEGGYEIVFVNPQYATRSAENDNIKDDPLGIGYWTIELTNTLPNIYRGDIVVNPGRTMNITLAPLGLPETEAFSRLGSDSVVNNQLQAGSSMMVVGDAAHVGYPGSDVTAQNLGYSIGDAKAQIFEVRSQMLKPGILDIRSGMLKPKSFKFDLRC